MRNVLIGIAALLAVASAASGGAIEIAVMKQKNGLWESTSATGRKLLFCTTDSVKINALKQTLEAFEQLGCRTVKDVVSGDDYELHLSCADPTFGKFQMTMKGTVRADYMSNSGTITGGNEFIQSLARNPDLHGEEWRWLRPCKAGEKPGLQD